LGDQPTHEVINSAGGTAAFVKCDVSDLESLETIFSTAVSEYGSVDVSVHAAGIGTVGAGVDVDETTYDSMMDVNLKGVYFSCQAALKRMIEQPDGGRIVNVSSIAGLLGRANMSVYCASKAGIANLTRSLATEYGPDGIRVNSVNPGVIETAMTAQNSGDLAERANDIPLRRIGQPGDVADAVLFLASNASSYVNGHNLVIDGGYTAGYG
jgi:NAD(P)-dependent dehydrogenase (short-subunit alcohol dehydrogenase family)